MLVKCPECELQVSDKALTCPHCGYPLKAEAPRQQHKKSNKRRRLPNGFGQISELKGRNLRKPFRAMVTVGKNSVGKPICKLLTPEAYFATYNEAYAALVEFNKHPYEIKSDVTLKELYDKWAEGYYTDEISQSRIRALTSTWDYCSAIFDVPAVDIRPSHVEWCMENGTRYNQKTKKVQTPSVLTKDRIKTLIAMVLDYGIKNGIVDKNYAKMVSLSKADRRQMRENKQEHMSFSPAELEILWQNITVPYVDLLLINCYSGWRPGELADLTIENTNIADWYFVGGKKTDSGRNRTVPIHPKIREFVLKYYNYAVANGSEYLFYREAIHWNEDHQMNYRTYANYFDRIMKTLKLNSDHKPHDCRKTFVTLAKSAGMDEYAIKRIVGHKISDLTEATYTERPLSWLRSEIEKIK